jgi:hypothetical protein
MPHARSPRAATRRAALPADAPWVTVVARAALIVYVGLIALCVVMPSHAGRVFWTVAVASLPLGIVLAGYHRWRRICPLAAIAQWPARVGRGGRHRAGPWLQAHAYQVVFGIFVACLWLRLVATNGDGLSQATQIWLNDGTGHFTAGGWALASTTATASALGNLDDDTDLDVLVVTFDGDHQVWLNQYSGPIFSDGFNAGNANAWSAVVP